jgi:hypothetical protein
MGRHMKAAARIAIMALGALALLAAASCQEPTRIMVRVTTDVDCSKESPTPVISIGGVESFPEEVPLAPLKVRCKPQSDQGTLVVVPPPSAAKDARLSIRVAMRYRSDLAPINEDCNLTSSPLCIVQRRALRFEPNGTIDLPIELNANCRGVFCSALATCNRAGQCVSAETGSCASGANCDPTSRDPDGGVLPDGGVGPKGDAATDGSSSGTLPDGAAVDGSPDAPIDGGGGITDGGLIDGSGASYESTIPGACVRCDKSGIETCCVKTAGGFGAICIPDTQTCSGEFPIGTATCQRTSHCNGDGGLERCCLVGDAFQCLSSQGNCSSACFDNAECKRLSPTFICRVQERVYATCGLPGP